MTDHYDQAEAIAQTVPDLPAAAPHLQVALAQVHATLALVDAVERLRADYAGWQALQ